MKIFLTGGTGYIGKNFIEYALKKKHIIYAPTRRRKNEKVKNLNWLIGSFDKNWKELKKSDVLIHLASTGVYRKHMSLNKCLEVNVIKSSKLLSNAINSKCLKWIIAGSCMEKKIKSKKFIKKIIREKKRIPFFNYALSKFLFTKISILVSKKMKIKCRVIRLFHVYGKNENKNRLWPSLIRAAKNNKNFIMTKGNQKRDFSHIDDISKAILESINFKKKSKKFPQLWEMATGKEMTVKSFAKKIWQKYHAKGKLVFNNLKDYDTQNYVANKKLLWKVNFRKI